VGEVFLGMSEKLVTLWVFVENSPASTVVYIEQCALWIHDHQANRDVLVRVREDDMAYPSSGPRYSLYHFVYESLKIWRLMLWYK
jgi:hypothetical protein